MFGKIVKWSAVVLGVLIGGLAVFFGFFFDLDEQLNTQKDKYIPELEKQIGRDIEVGSVATTIFPVLGAELRDVVIKGQAPEDPPLLTLDKVAFEVELWAAIKSAGTEVRLKSLVLDGMAVNLTIAPDGTLNYQDIIDRLASGPPEPPKPLDPDAVRFIKSLELQKVAITNGKFNLTDNTAAGGAAQTAINDLEVVLEDVVLASPFEVTVKAAAFADTRNLEFKARMGPIPIDNPDAGFPIKWVTLKAEGVDIAAIAPYLGDAAPVAVESAQLTADLKVDDPLAAKGRIQTSGSIQVADVRIGQPPGEAFTLSVKPNLDLHLAKGEVVLNGVTAGIDDMQLEATGRAYILARRPRFEGVTIKTSGFHFGRLLKRVPQIASALPKGARLDGPFSVDVTANGDTETQSAKATLKFTEADIFLPETLAKPAGTPLSLEFDATLAKNDLDLRSARLRAASLDLKLAGTVKNFDDPVMDLKGGTGRFAIDGLMRLLPNVRKAVPADVKIAGQADVDVNFVGNAKSMDGRLVLGVYNADLAVPGTTLKGTGAITATAKGSPESLAINVDAGLTPMTIIAGSAFRKPAGTALAIKANGGVGGGGLRLASFAVDLGPLKVTGSGSVSGGNLDLKANIPEFQFAGLASIVPALGEGLLARSSFGAQVAFKGDPGKPATVDAKLDKMTFKVGKNALSGDLSVANLDAPRVRFQLSSPMLDLDDMFPPSKEEASGESGPLPPIVKKIDAAGGLKVAKGRSSDVEFRNLNAQLTMKNGVVRFDTLEFTSYDGQFSASKSKVDLGAAEPNFDLDVNVKRVDLAAILTDQANLPRTLSGRATTQMRVRGKGSEWRTISKTLTGDLAMNLKDGKFESLQLQDELFGGLKKKVPFLKLPKARGTALKTLFAQFSVSNGQMKLVKPLKMDTPQGPMTLTGGIGLDSSLDLKGTIQVPASLIRKLTRNKIKPKSAIPVALNIGGTLKKPKISGVDAAALATVLVGGAAAALAQDKLDEAKRIAEEAKAKAEAEARKVAAKAKAEAEKKANELKDKAKAEAKKAEEKAKKAAKSAAKKAEEEAKKRLRGLF